MFKKQLFPALERVRTPCGYTMFFTRLSTSLIAFRESRQGSGAVPDECEGECVDECDEDGGDDDCGAGVDGGGDDNGDDECEDECEDMCEDECDYECV